jgi:iron-sulfur cluster repair protein YtfE (RIC family)
MDHCNIEELVLGNARAMHRRLAAAEADVSTALGWAEKWRRVSRLQHDIIGLYTEMAREDAALHVYMTEAIAKIHGDVTAPHRIERLKKIGKLRKMMMKLVEEEM